MTAACVPGTCSLWSILRERPCIKKLYILPDGRFLCLEYFYALLIELAQGTATDAAYYYSVNLLIIQGHNRITGAMFMVLIAVAYSHYTARACIDNYKYRRGTEMIKHKTFHLIVIQHWKTNLHLEPPADFIMSI
jgi:hypothetical protein